MPIFVVFAEILLHWFGIVFPRFLHLFPVFVHGGDGVLNLLRDVRVDIFVFVHRNPFIHVGLFVGDENSNFARGQSFVEQDCASGFGLRGQKS